MGEMVDASVVGVLVGGIEALSPQVSVLTARRVGRSHQGANRTLDA